jgi:hypothetical protein
MFGKLLPSIIAAVAGVAACAPAMSAPASPCRVIGGEKLPGDSGGPTGICSAVERAIASTAPTLKVSVEVRVLSNSALSAAIVANGRKLPDQHFAISDRVLNRGAIDRFAQAIAQAAKDGAAKG